MGLLDFLTGTDGGVSTIPSTGGGGFDFMSKLPGAQYLTPEERQGAIGLALLKAGAMGLQASQGRPGMPQPTLGQTAGAMAAGIGEGLHGMGDQALKGAAIQAQMMGKQKSILEAQQLAQKNAAIQAFAAGDRSPQVLALLNPDKAVEQMYKPDEHLASKGMQRNPQTGQVEYLPGYTQAMTQEAEAKSAGTYQPIVAGGALVKPPAAGVAGPPSLGPGNIMANNPLAMAATNAAQSAGVDPRLFASLVSAESNWNPGAQSPKGAVGLSQLMPDTAKQLGVNPSDPVQNLKGGATYLKALQDKYSGDTTKALMAYNWGPGKVDAWLASGANPSQVPAETHAYVRKVLGQANAPQGGPDNYIRDNGGNVVGIRSPDSAAENTFDKTTGESLGKLFIGKQEAVAANRQSYSKMQAISDILKNIETGKGSEALLEGKRSLKALGIDLNAIGLADNVGAQDAARALANEMALELRNPAGGAGMPGAMSDPDRLFLQSMAGGLTMTPQGRDLLLQSRKMLAERSAEEARIVRQYAKSHGGRLDIGVYDALDQLAQRPMFNEAFRAKVQALGGGASPAGRGPVDLSTFWQTGRR